MEINKTEKDLLIMLLRKQKKEIKYRLYGRMLKMDIQFINNLILKVEKIRARDRNIANV